MQFHRDGAKVGSPPGCHRLAARCSVHEEGVESLIDPARERGQQEVGLRVDAPQLLLSRLVAEQAEQQVIHGTPYNAVPNE